MKLYTQSLCAVAAWNLMCMPRYKLLLKRKGWKRGDLTKTRDRWTYRVVVPLNGKALFMPEEFIVKAIRPRRRWHEEEEIAGFPRRRGETLEVWGAKPPEVTEELISAAIGFKGTNNLKVSSTSKLLSCDYLTRLLLGAICLCCCLLRSPCREIYDSVCEASSSI